MNPGERNAAAAANAGMKPKDREEYRLLQLGWHRAADDSLEAHHGPGSYGSHELVDRSFLVLEMLGDYVLTHPACLLDPELYRLADEAHDRLYELYQKAAARDDRPAALAKREVIKP